MVGESLVRLDDAVLAYSVFKINNLVLLVAKVVKTFGDRVGCPKTLDEFRYQRIKL